MDTKALIEEVKAEIERLQQVVLLLEGGKRSSKGSTGKRKLSAEARKAIGDAQRARWAKKRKAQA